MSIYLFCEGQTEKNVITKFTPVSNPSFQGRGKSQVNKEMTSTLGPLLRREQVIRALVMRDVDKGEHPGSIVQSVTNAVQSMLRERGFSEQVQFQQNPTYPNIYSLTLQEAELRLALHLATYKWKETFVNATIDDYVLALSLYETTVASLLRKKKWKTTSEQVIRKVTERIPALLGDNGIPLCEAKDYVRLYAAVIQEHTSPATFAKNILANAEVAARQEVFASLFAALSFLGVENDD